MRFLLACPAVLACQGGQTLGFTVLFGLAEAFTQEHFMQRDRDSREERM